MFYFVGEMDRGWHGEAKYIGVTEGIWAGVG